MMGNRQGVILYLKKNQMNWVEQSTQTKNLRNDTNKRIQKLGNKYYFIKTLFERMNLKRDDLFNIGKELENDFRYSKTGVHLQNQKRRMKEALYCWYCENFFSEICHNDPVVLGKLNKISKNKKIFDEIKRQIFQLNISQIEKINDKKISNSNDPKSQNKNNTESHHFYSNTTNTKSIDQRKLLNDKKNDEKLFPQSSILSEARTNEEIDAFDYSLENTSLDNFNFELKFNF